MNHCFHSLDGSRLASFIKPIIAATLLTLLVIVGGDAAFAQDNTVSIDNVTVGLDNVYRVGFFTQVRAEVKTSEAISNVRLELVLPDGEGVQSTTVRDGLSLSAGTQRIEGLAKFGRVNGDLVVRVRDESGVLLAEKSISADVLPDAVLATQNLVVSIGPSIEIAEALSLRQEKREQETVHGLIKEAALLPTHWLGYGGVSVVVLPGSDAGLASQMSVEQLDALDRWVQMGGRLIFSSGEDAAEVLGEGGPLARFAPGKFDRVQMQRQTSGIENFVGKTKMALDSYVDEDDLTFRIPMSLLSEQRGSVLVTEGIGGNRTPMIIRASHGFGHVVFVAVDLDKPPMSNWKGGRRRLVGLLLDVAIGTTSREEGDKQYSQLTQIGFDDMTGQLRASLDQFTNVRLVPFSWIAILIGLYIVLIGPIDYLLLRKLNKRFSLTWVTFPLLVLAGCALAFYLTQSWKGQKLRANQVDIIDIDTQTGLLRGMTWAHVFSPTSRKYDLMASQSDTLFPIQEPRGQVASWQGLPGKSFGGMNTTRLSQSSDDYLVECDLNNEANQTISVSQLPIDVYASRSLNGLVWGQVELPEINPIIADVENQLKGEVKNPLPVDLKDCLLCYDRWVYPLATMPAGGASTIDRFSAKTIDGMLTRTKVDVDFKDRSVAWDRKSMDVERIMEMMMFYNAAGGASYTSLLHRFQSEVDFTDHLNQGTAMLMGKIEHSPCNLISGSQLGDADGTMSGSSHSEGKVADESESVTYVRILMPVKTKLRSE